MRQAVFFAGLMLLPGLGGCKARDSREKLMEDLIRATDEIGDVLDEVRDTASAKAALPTLEKLAERIQEIQKKGLALGLPSAEEEDRLQKRYGPELRKTAERLRILQERIKSIPGLQEFRLPSV